MPGQCSACAAGRPTSARFEPARRFRGSTTGSLHVAPSCLACRTRPVWQSRTVPSLSGLLPPSLAPPRSGCPQLQPGCCDSPAVGPFTPPGHIAPRGARPCQREPCRAGCAAGADPAVPAAQRSPARRPPWAPAAGNRGCWQPTAPPPAAARWRRSAGGTWTRAWLGRPGLRQPVPPRRARTLTESIAARDQSTWPSSPSQSSSRWCRASQTPACCQSRSRRQQVTPLPQPSSRAGSSRQGTPARST